MWFVIIAKVSCYGEVNFFVDIVCVGILYSKPVTIFCDVLRPK